MASVQNISKAAQIFVGNAVTRELQRQNRSRGVPVEFLTKVDLGTPIVADADYLVAAATSAELPDNATKTYTTANDGTTPLDNAATPAPSSITTQTGTTASVWALDVPRNLTAAVSHGSSVVAMTITITGYDEYYAKVRETLTIAATGTSQTAAGKKAFAYIETIAITSAGNATTNTLNLGIGDVLGLPYKLTALEDCLSVWLASAADSATVVAAVSTTPSATTGDVRGTVDTNGALDGSKRLIVWMHVQDPNTRTGLIGVSQYAG